MSEAFERRIRFRPAFDKRDPDPKKNYGVGAATLRFELIGPAGAVHFVMSTGWYLPHVQRQLAKREAEWIMEHGSPLSFRPGGWDVGYHSPTPRSDWQAEGGPRDCDLLPGGTCYGDGSGLQAETIMEQFLAEGEDYLWAELERRYHHLFVEESAHG